jgi:signal transduction histidine kinase
MSAHPDGYALLKATIALSASTLPIETKLEKILQCITNGFQSDRSLHLRPETILKEGFLSRVAEEKKSLWVDEERPFREERVLPEERGLLCPAFGCIPLYDETSFEGIFYIGFSKGRTFSSSEVELLLLLAKEIGAAIRNDQLHRVAKDHERRVRQLSTLWELNKALLTTVNFERIVHMTLTAITMGDGFGFNRAILFLVDEKGHVVQGTMAVGPNSAEEAGKIWSALSQRRGNLSELVAQIESSTENHSVLNSIVKEIKVPLEHEQCILSRTVLEGRSFNIRFPLDGEEWVQTRCERGCALSSEVGCYVSEHLSRNPRIYAYATLPLWGKGKVIGVILVDNLFNQHPITDEDIRYLTMFSSQAGLAIENALLYRNLEDVHQELKEAQTFLVHREKMAALGELSTSIAHEIRNPLVSIGGFARRLDRTLPADASEKRYTRTIVKEVERVENILSQFLTYTHEEPLALKELDLREVMEESLSMISESLRNGGIQLDKEFSEKVPGVKGDYYQLKQAFFNLISNAYESMNGKGRLSIRIHPLWKNGSSFVRVEVEDTGAGIDPESLHHIFNPFYTTKDNRLGLGLPIIHKIATFHQGQIEVNNHPGKGVTFLLTLPAQEEKQR